MNLPPISRPLPVREVLSLLVRETFNRIHQTQKPNVYALPPVTFRIRRLLVEYKRLSERRLRVVKALKQAGFDDSEKPKVSYDLRRQREVDFATALERRERAVNDLRIQALLDLAMLPREHARQYLLKLQKKLRAI